MEAKMNGVYPVFLPFYVWGSEMLWARWCHWLKIISDYLILWRNC